MIVRNFLPNSNFFYLNQYSKIQFKKLVKEKVQHLNKVKFLEKAKSKKYKKINIDDLMQNDFQLKQYFRRLNIVDARIKFKLVSFMLPSVKMNFQNDKKFASDLWSCEGCSKFDGFFSEKSQLLMNTPTIKGYIKRDNKCRL